MKGFIYTLTESKPYPKALLFVNSGVRLTTEGAEVIGYLRQLEGEGVEILSCGTCLDYFNLKNKLLVGGVSNMYTIVEKMNGAKNTIKI
jgi:selenium metabolism protein YedF